MAETTFQGIEAIAAAEAADMPFAMDEQTFRAFYDRTAPGLWAYLSRLSGDRQLADDLLQETYYRLLRSRETFEGEAHQRNYLFRIATNLVRDARRGRFGAWRNLPLPDMPGEPEPLEARADVQRALARLKPRDRALLWLAYAQGSSHNEIAGVLGVKTASIKLLLYRARRRMAGLLTPGGFAAPDPPARALSRRSAGALRSRDSLAGARGGDAGSAGSDLSSSHGTNGLEKDKRS